MEWVIGSAVPPPHLLNVPLGLGEHVVGCLAATHGKAALTTAEVPKPQAACQAQGAPHIGFLITTFSCTQIVSSVIHHWYDLCTRRSWAKGEFPYPQETSYHWFPQLLLLKSYQLSHILVLSQNKKGLGRRATHLLPSEGERCAAAQRVTWERRLLKFLFSGDST